MKDSRTQSISEQNREPLPFLQRKKIGAQSYVSERISRLRNQKVIDNHRKVGSIEQNPEDEKTAKNRWKQINQIRDLRKNFLVSSNKVVNSQQVLSSFQPFRKQLELLRKRPTATINYEDMLSNLHPFSNAIRELQLRKASESKKKMRSIQDNPSSLKLYRSIPKSKQSSNNRQQKPQSQYGIKHPKQYFLNIEKINLRDSQERNNKKPFDCYHSSLGDKRASTYSLDEIQENQRGEQVYGLRGNFAKIKLKILQQGKKEEKEKNKQLDYCSEIKVLIDQEYLEDQSVVKKEEQQNKKSSPLKQIRKKKKLTIIPFETYYYRIMLWKVNFSNNLSVQIPQEYQHRLKVYIGKGNNSGLVRGLIKRRIWFAVTERIQDANFVWTQLKSLPYFKIQTGSNNKPQPSNPSKYPYGNCYISKADQLQMKKYLENYVLSQERADQRLLGRSKYFQLKSTQSIKISQIKNTRIQNHLINNYVIGNKKALFNTMSCYYTQINEDVFDYLPLTFHIKQGIEDQTYFKFLKYYYNRAKQIKSENSKSKNIWIVKPGENSNRGNGIKVCLDLEEIKAILKKKQMYPDGTYRTYIVQAYIQKPLLYNKRKFDIRHYMMISCVNGVVKGYWYREGYVRTTSTEYSLGTNCSKIHLTNDAVQKNLPDYGKFQKGNKLSYDDLEAYILKASGKKKKPISFHNQILPQMKKIATDAIRACSGGIDPQRRQNNFEVFGLDFMIDADFKLYMIEINTNPCLQLSCPLLSSIIPKMVQNTLQMTLDALFPPPVRYYPKSMHYFKNLEEENRYELVYDSRYDKLYDCGLVVLDQKMLEEEDDTFQDDGEEFDPQD